MIGVRTPSGNKGVASISIRTAGGNKGIARGSILTPSGSKVFFSPSAGGLTVDVSPPSATGSAFVNEAVFVTTGEVTASASGGTAPYTYAWTRISGDAGFTILSGASASTRFRITLDQGENAEAAFRCTATDARGRTGTFDISATAFNYGSLGGTL